MDWCTIFKSSKYFWKEEKAKLLLERRNIDLEEIKKLLQNCRFEIVDVNHSPYEHQNFVVVIYHNYPTEVVFYHDKTKNTITIITAYPNRNYKILLSKKQKWEK